MWRTASGMQRSLTECLTVVNTQYISAVIIPLLKILSFFWINDIKRYFMPKIDLWAKWRIINESDKGMNKGWKNPQKRNEWEKEEKRKLKRKYFPELFLNVRKGRRVSKNKVYFKQNCWSCVSKRKNKETQGQSYLPKVNGGKGRKKGPLHGSQLEHRVNKTIQDNLEA